MFSSSLFHISTLLFPPSPHILYYYSVFSCTVQRQYSVMGKTPNSYSEINYCYLPTTPRSQECLKITPGLGWPLATSGGWGGSVASSRLGNVKRFGPGDGAWGTTGISVENNAIQFTIQSKFIQDFHSNSFKQFLYQLK